mmetsp:Transcript_7672/g.24158  ORF Transcript_7672/g.24158 Transcript_7672/m.24158 type:complete len:110 (+) Transcript_7672:276-605(+)
MEGLLQLTRMLRHKTFSFGTPDAMFDEFSHVSIHVRPVIPMLQVLQSRLSSRVHVEIAVVRVPHHAVPQLFRDVLPTIFSLVMPVDYPFELLPFARNAVIDIISSQLLQ